MDRIFYQALQEMNKLLFLMLNRYNSKIQVPKHRRLFWEIQKNWTFAKFSDFGAFDDELNFFCLLIDLFSEVI